MNYNVRAKRWEHGWELHIDGVGVTQSRSLWDAEMMARDLISRREGIPADSFDVAITPEIGGGLDEQTRAAREAVTDADRASLEPKLAALRALLDARDPDRTAVALLVDREEEGSHRAGARSELVDATEACLAQAAQVRPGALFARSQALSADVKAGVDPLFPQVHELRNAPVLGGGPTLVKFTGGGWFRGSEAHAELVAAVRALAARIGVPLQGSLSGRVDEGGGGTIALFLAQRGMDVVDVGLPVLSMHSPFEISAKSDLYQGYRLFMAFFEEPVTP